MGRNWSPKYKVECNWCFWNGTRTKRCLSNRCPKCRKERTVEKFDPDKVYSPEEFERHRKMKMVEAGAREIRPEVWICERPRMCADKEMKILREFEDYRSLYDLMFKESVSWWIAQAYRKGLTHVKLCDAFIEIEQRKGLGNARH